MAITLNSRQKKGGVILLLLFLCAVKLPAILSADIQPNDEGVYATNVKAIHKHGDFLDQSNHTVGGSSTGTVDELGLSWSYPDGIISHPPLMIWIGYFATSVFGTHDFVFKLIPFIFGLLCVLFIIKSGELIHSYEAGFLAALIFSSTYLFTVYAKRFQFDIVIAFWFILSFYLLARYFANYGKKNFYWSAVIFGFCLMTKSLFGLIIPFIIFLFWLLSFKYGKKIKFSEIVLFVFIGLIIALPWHLYMVSSHGSGFIDYILGYHIFMRATEGIGDNSKPSGVFYYLSILMNNIPFVLVLGYFFAKHLFGGAFKIKNCEWKGLLLWVWSLTGIVILSLFITKIDAYLVPFIAPVCILIVIYFVNGRTFSSPDTFFIMLFFIINLFWYLTAESRNEIKAFLFTSGGMITAVLSLVVLSAVIYFISRRYYNRIDLSKVFSYLVVIIFVGTNIYYTFNISLFEDGLKLSEIKKLADGCGRGKIVYVSSRYHSNPQFSYYFDGLDLGWENKYDFKLLDLENGPGPVKDQLMELEKGSFIIIVERDNINPGEYYDTGLFMPGDAGLVKKTHGYEMYLN